MVLWLIRVAFILVIFGVGYAAIAGDQPPLGRYTWLLLAASLIIGVFVMIGDYVAPRRKLSIFAGAFFGLLVGIVLAYALSFVTQPIIDQFVVPRLDLIQGTGVISAAVRARQVAALTQYVNLIVGSITCYLSVSFVLQTKDDFRFIVPYVEFAKQSKGSRPIVLDSSALIDGRIADVAATGVFDTQFIVPRFVLDELQQVADSSDKLKRNRGRRGLDVVARLQKLPKVDLAIHEASYLDADKDKGVDALVMRLATELSARVVTTDFNLNKVALVSGVDVINLNDLANAVKSEALPGETLHVRIVRPGEESQQGVGFMDDGTMVVVEHGRPHVGEDVNFVVTNTRQTSAGKMIFGRLFDPDAPDEVAPPPTPRDEPRRNEPQQFSKRGNGFGRSPRRGGENR